MELDFITDRQAKRGGRNRQFLAENSPYRRKGLSKKFWKRRVRAILGLPNWKIKLEDFSAGKQEAVFVY